MKSITIAGGITRDAVTRTTPNGDKVTGWSVAVDERNGQDKRTLYFDCTLWGKRGESLAQYLTKGGKVSVCGELSTRDHDGKTYLTIRVDQVTLLGGKPEGERQEQSGQAKQSGGYGGGGSANSGRSEMDDEIPF